ncbi:unnamed protein product [Prorocentrum cordatum]|uniref:Methyltransferase type 11 domain-containing protein n=1 Tax=Prorocentrum cordatum TaxID=2364126 RepID=A0ABN9W774_9DINO|nr:unnamed protein product [Polarella glacialis]
MCSQHDSHLPSDVEYNSLTVHGMNFVELMANQRATDRFTQNFNSDTSLARFADGSLDAALMAVSIQYMQSPVELLREVRRTLRPGGVCIVSFSNRMFFTKAIDAWRSCKSMSSLANLVKGYFADAGFVGTRVANRVAADGAGPLGDPFVAVVGFRDSAPEGALQHDEISWMPGMSAGGIW